MYIPRKRALRLVEIQESVLPEDEWLIGVSDLGYFKGVGYSMPIVEESNSSDDVGNLYAFLPGLFFCSAQQTSVDGVLVEVSHKEIAGVLLPSFRPEDVRTFDVGRGISFDEKGKIKPIEITYDTLGSFGVESFLKDTGLEYDTFNYKREMQIASRLAEMIPLSELKKAYVSSSFLQSRITRLLDDIEFFGLSPRNRIYVRNTKHPYGSVVDVKYRGLEDEIEIDTGTGIKCPDNPELEKELSKLSFSKLVDSGVETDVERAILDMLLYIRFEFEGNVSRNEVLHTLFGGSST
ncbi:MAG: hypothetical protein ACFFE3_07295 [Candidatus Thorarchaeota archaeon]